MQTAFWTPYGRYRYSPFSGIFIAPYEFECKLQEKLDGVCSERLRSRPQKSYAVSKGNKPEASKINLLRKHCWIRVNSHKKEVMNKV